MRAWRLSKVALLLLVLIEKSKDALQECLAFQQSTKSRHHPQQRRRISVQKRTTLAAYWTPVNTDVMLHRASRKAAIAVENKPFLAALVLKCKQLLLHKFTRWILVSVISLRLLWAIYSRIQQRGKIDWEQIREQRYQQLLERQRTSSPSNNGAVKNHFDWRNPSSKTATKRNAPQTLDGQGFRSPSYMNPTLQGQQAKHRTMPYRNTSYGSATSAPNGTNRNSPYYNRPPPNISNGVSESTDRNTSFQHQQQNQQQQQRRPPPATRWEPQPPQQQRGTNNFQQQSRFPNQVNGGSTNEFSGTQQPYDYQNKPPMQTNGFNAASQMNGPPGVNSNTPGNLCGTTIGNVQQQPPPIQQNPIPPQYQQPPPFQSPSPPMQQQQQQQQQQHQQYNPQAPQSPQVQTMNSQQSLVTPHGVINPPTDPALSQLQTTTASQQQPPHTAATVTNPAQTNVSPDRQRTTKETEEKENLRRSQEEHWQKVILDSRNDILHPSLRRLFSSPDAIPVIQTLLHHLELAAATASSIEHLRNNVVGRRRAWMLLRHVRQRSYCVVYDANEDRAIVAIGDLTSKFQTAGPKDHSDELLTNIVAFKNTLFHRGIVEDALELRRDILDCLKTTTSPNLPVIFVGHGRGGAMAAVLGLLQHQERQRPVEVVAFGPPPVWNIQDSTHSYMTSIVCEQDFIPSGSSANSMHGAPNNNLVVPGRVIVLYEREGDKDKRIAPPPVHRAEGLEEVYMLFEEFQSKYPGASVGAVFHPDGSSLGASAPVRMDPDHEIAVQHDKLKRLVRNLKTMNDGNKA